MKAIRVQSATLLALMVAATPLLSEQRSADPAMDVFRQQRKTYANDGNLKVKFPYLPLPPGAVKPKGWLRDWAVAAASGITGHIDENSKSYAEAWKAHGFEAMGAKPDGTGWPLEGVSYWLDGAIRLAAMLDDQTLEKKARQRMDLVINGVLGGGSSFIYWLPTSTLDDSFNNWAHSQMGRALVAYYRVTGDPRILRTLVKAYSEFPLPDLVNKFGSVSGAVNLDPMLETYVLSGDRRVLDRALSYSQRTAYREIAGDWLAGNIPVGHGVIFYENLRVPALLYPWTGDEKDLAASRKAIEWHDQYLLPFGVSSAEEWHAGVGATRNTETCDVAAAMWTYQWLHRVSSDTDYLDRIERIFLNAGPAPVDREFKTMCYYQSPNRYSHTLPGDPPHNPGAGSYDFTNICHPVPCCVGNVNRIIPTYVESMWMATADRGLAAMLYGPSTVRALVADDVVAEIESKTNFPFDEEIILMVRPAKKVTFPLELRIPTWSGTPRIRVNGKVVDMRAAVNGRIRIEREWSPDDSITIRFPMSVRVVKGRETPYPQLGYFKPSRKIAQLTDINSPYASVYYGPLLFALPIADETPNRVSPNARFNYALDTNARKVRVHRSAMPTTWNWPLDAPIQLVADVRQFGWTPTENRPLPDTPIRDGSAAKVRLVPYGCTKFRVSMFPITEKMWHDGR